MTWRKGRRRRRVFEKKAGRRRVVCERFRNRNVVKKSGRESATRRHGVHAARAIVRMQGQKAEAPTLGAGVVARMRQTTAPAHLNGQRPHAQTNVRALAHAHTRTHARPSSARVLTPRNRPAAERLESPAHQPIRKCAHTRAHALAQACSNSQVESVLHAEPKKAGLNQ
eukprot:6200959-Pleurochrysis_carterae.AAC.2